MITCLSKDLLPRTSSGSLESFSSVSATTSGNEDDDLLSGVSVIFGESSSSSRCTLEIYFEI